VTPQPDSFAALQLKDQVAVVTGGSRGIGRATAQLLADLGAHVVVNYVNNAKAADEVVNDLRSKELNRLPSKQT
jgi:NAD(P)-dependent dehydrogenase (short-subunit alcohol dehydrogenase family)